MARAPEADFAIFIDFEKGSRNPARVFKAAEGLIRAFEDIDRSLIFSIDSKIETVLLLEDIEAGSLRAWLRNAISTVDDDDLKKLDLKATIGKYLVKGKYILIDLLNKSTTISDRKEIEGVRDSLLELAEETDVRHIPTYRPMSLPGIARQVERLSEAKSYLNENDKLEYQTNEESIGFNMRVNIAPGSFDEILSKERIRTQLEMILKVKKPDYLGQSRWEFHHAGRAIEARINHDEWLKEFQSRQVDVRPGDALRARVIQTVNYGHDNEVIGTKYEIDRVIEIIHQEPQPELFQP